MSRSPSPVRGVIFRLAGIGGSCAAVILGLSGQCVAGTGPADWATIRRRGELRLAADASSGLPYFRRNGKAYEGFEAELGRALARRLGLKAVFIQTPWRDLTTAVRGGDADVALNGLEIRDEPELRYSTPYYVASQAILVRQQVQQIYVLQDLAGRKVGSTRGSIAAAILAHLKPPAKSSLFSDTGAPFQALAAGQVDAVLLESAMVRHLAKRHAKEFRVAGVPVLPRSYGIAVARANAPLVGLLDAGLKAMRESGEHRRILEAAGIWDSLQMPAGKPKSAAAKPASRLGTRGPGPHHR